LAALAAVASVFALNAGVAHAAPGTVTVRYKVFPGGAQLLPPEVVKGSVTDTAKTTLYGKKSGVTYQFLFWNVNGVPQTNAKMTDAPKAGATDFATAWYEKQGVGGKCAPSCAVATWAFSSTDDHVMKGVTPVKSVSPSGLWTSPSTSVSTMTSSPSVVITARPSIMPPYPGVTFQMWIGPMPSGSTVTASANTDAEAIGFYKSPPRPPPKPGPCPTSNPDCHY
jgi:hypothetical protein